MTTTRLPEPERWTERSPGTSAESLLGAALRGARAATAPSERLLMRVDAGLQPRGALSFGAFRWQVAAGALVALLAVAGTVGAARGPLRVWAERHGLGTAAARPSSSVLRGSPVRHPRVAAVADVAVASVSAEPSRLAAPPATAPALAPVPSAVARAPRPEGVRADREAPAPVLEEARVLQRAFHALRSETADPLEALAAIDDHDRRFPSGLLGGEARLARVEALLALGRRAEALRALDAGDVGLTRAMRLARGELRAESGRCGEGVRDFAAVLTSAADDELGGRALYGSASCALRAGDDAAAVISLRRYLEVQPTGAEAAQARAALERLTARAPSP